MSARGKSETKPRRPAPAPVPRLDIRGPVLAGTTVIALFLGAGVGGAAIAPIDNGLGLPGTIIVETKIKPVQHERGGTVGGIHVAEGDEVATGDILISLDTRSLDEQIAALKAQAEASARQLALAREEAGTMRNLLERKLAARSRVLGLERQVAEIEKEVASLDARIAVAAQELERAVVRAPVGGRILSLKVNVVGAVIQPGATLVEIVPRSDRLVIEGRLTPAQIEEAKPGMSAKVWLTALSWRDQRPLPAKLAWVSPDSIEDPRTGTRHFIARVEIDPTALGPDSTVKLLPGMRTEVLLLTGQRTLLDQLLDPLMRNINRAFRG